MLFAIQIASCVLAKEVSHILIGPVQNYIDNTGVQVADVVIGFVHMEKKNLAQVRELAAQSKFDYLCWDVYARAAQFLAEDKTRAAALRGETLKAIEASHSEIAEMGAVIADAIVSLHLQTMARLIAPAMPHLAEEIHHRLNPTGKNLLAEEAWPDPDPALLVADAVTIAVQVMGKLRATIEMPPDSAEAVVLQAAETEPNVARALEGKHVVKRIHVPNRIVNFVVAN